MAEANALVGAELDSGAGLSIGLPKSLLNHRKSGTLAQLFYSWHSGTLTSLVAPTVAWIAGARVINRAEPRACGHSRDPSRLDTEPETERNVSATSDRTSNGLAELKGRIEAWISSQPAEIDWKTQPGHKRQLALEGFWRERLPVSREGTDWRHVLQTRVTYRLIEPGSEWRWHRDG